MLVGKERIVLEKERSIADVLHDILWNIQELVASEVRLAAVELKEQGAKMIQAGRPLAAGIVLGLYGLGFFLVAAMYGLATILAPWLAAAIVGVVVSAVATALIAVGKKRWRMVAKPDKTIESLKENIEWAKIQRS